VAAVWNRAAEGEPDAMQAGRFHIDLAPPSPTPERQHRGFWGPRSRRPESRAGRQRDSRRDAGAPGAGQ
jgi:hypothetical protein